MTATDRGQRPTAHATDAVDVEVLPRPVETRQRELNEPALYCVEDRRHSGKWRVVAETHDVHEARRIARLIAWAGGSVRVQIIPRPINDG